jgi:hypothetical protein
MAKKCIPGLFCVENMTLFILFILALIMIYMSIQLMNQSHPDRGSINSNNMIHDTTIVNNYPSRRPFWSSLNPFRFFGRNSGSDVFSDPYAPPLQDNVYGGSSNLGIFYQAPPIRYGMSMPSRGVVPVNVETQLTGTSFNQVGILTRKKDDQDLILPLFGRNLYSNRNKWQYYAISNTGNVQTKLPIRVDGRDAMSDNGVDEIYGGSSVYVQGYDDTFTANVYNMGGLAYLPVF